MPRSISALDFLALIHVQFPVPVEGILTMYSQLPYIHLF